MSSIVVLGSGQAKAWPLAGVERTQATELRVPRGISLVGYGFSSTYARLYQEQPWIHVVVNKIARGVARVTWGAYIGDVVTREPAPGHPVSRLLRRPFPRGSGFYLREAITGSLAIYGHAVCAKARPGIGQPPNELWPMNFQNVTIHGDEDEPISLYEYRAAGVRRFFQPEDVVHFMWWGPDGLGVSPMEPLRRTLAMEDAAQRYAIASFANGARPSGALVVPGRLPDPDRKTLRREIEAMHGGVDNAFRIALLSNGMDWKPFAHSAQEAEVISHRKLNREEVSAVYDIPPPMIQILDRATFSNIDEQHVMWYQDTLGPWLTMEAETLDVQLTEPEPGWKNVSVRFDLGEVLRGDPDKRATSQQRRFQTGLATPNELRIEDGQEPIGDPEDDANPANHIYVPVNLMAIDGKPPEEPPPTEPQEPLLDEDGNEVEPEVVPGQASRGGHRAASDNLHAAVTALAHLMLMEKTGSNGNGHHPAVHLIQPERLEHVTHEKHEHVQNIYPRDVVREEVEEALKAALDNLQMKSVGGERRFVYDDRGLVSQVIEGEKTYHVQRDQDDRLVQLVPEEAHA